MELGGDLGVGLAAADGERDLTLARAERLELLARAVVPRGGVALAGDEPDELAGDRRLVVGVLQPDSPYVGTTVAVSGRQLGGGDANIIAILRGEHMTVPNAKMRFEAGDRLILVVSAAYLDEVRRVLAPW